ncbi:MAG: efflux RND transporter periplasmic adaptor subunit [Opitutaceae bacterium]|jgi:membrane fusion protein (multidrug efflux system)|nr:efflux RND transporter periplasmic adaptor subunit [Opitutaceae bacterium]
MTPRSLLKKHHALPLLAAALLAAAPFSGCAKKAAAPQAGPIGPGGLEVGVVTLKARPVTLRRELPGRTNAFRVAEVRARASGVVLKQFFTEGADVREGQQLYQIDPAPYQTALDSARAALLRAEAALNLAKIQERRQADLLKEKVASQSDYDLASATLATANADLAAAKAAVATAEINLEYTKVLSPISGRVGKSLVTEGAYAQAGAATLLAVVQQLDPIYVDIVQPAGQVLQLDADRKSGALLTPPDAGSVKLKTHDGRPFSSTGKLLFTDVTVEQSTSSVLLRAEFPNPAKPGKLPELLPGLFVRAEIIEGVSPNALLVPQQGVSRNMKGQPTALVVVSREVQGRQMAFAEQRVLKADRTIGNHWLVTDGVKDGEQVIVENLQILQRAGLNVPVKPVPAGHSLGSLPIVEPATK